jgi:hypothetical protein
MSEHNDDGGNISRKQFLGMLGGFVGTLTLSSLLPFDGTLRGSGDKYGNSAYGGKK